MAIVQVLCLPALPIMLLVFVCLRILHYRVRFIYGHCSWHQRIQTLLGLIAI